MTSTRARRGAICVLVTGAALAMLLPAGRAAGARTTGYRYLPALTMIANDALTKALVSGEISESEYAFERARSLFKLANVREEFGHVEHADAHDATLILRDLVVRLGRLPARARHEAAGLVARPTDGQADPQASGYSAPEAIPDCSTRTCIHYVDHTKDAPNLEDADANGVPDYIDSVLSTFEEVWDEEITVRGFRAPKPDAASKNNGGDARLDVYVADLGVDSVYGYCTSDDPNLSPSSSYKYLDSSAYCVVDDDFSASQFPDGANGLDALRVTAAHEFNHASQFAYDLLEDAWFQEASAVWIEDEVYDSINDNLFYLEHGPLGRPSVPLDSFLGRFNSDALFPYGAWIFPRFFSETYDPNIIREIWERADAAPNGPDEYSVKAIASVLGARGGNFGSTYETFASTNVYPASFYEEGVLYPEPPRDRSVGLDPTHPAKGIMELDHLTTRYISFVPDPDIAPDEMLTVRVNLSEAVRGSHATLVSRDDSEDVQIVPIALDGEGDGMATVPFGDRAEVVLVLANASRRFTRCYRGITNYSCSGGVPVDDSRRYSFSAQAGTQAPEPPNPRDSADDRKAPRISRVSDSPDPFTPSRGRRRRVTISWTVSEDSDSSVSIYRPSGRRVKVLGGGFTPKGRWYVRWSGRRAGGRLVKPGTYIYKIVAIDAQGNRGRAGGRVTVVR